MALLDADAFPDIGAIKPENVAPFVIRTEKRRAIDDRGEPLFQPLTTRLVPVEWRREMANWRDSILKEFKKGIVVGQKISQKRPAIELVTLR